MSKKLGVRTTFLDENTFKLTFYPDFATTLINAFVQSGKLELVLQKLDIPTDKGFSHKILFDKDIQDNR